MNTKHKLIIPKALGDTVASLTAFRVLQRTFGKDNVVAVGTQNSLAILRGLEGEVERSPYGNDKHNECWKDTCADDPYVWDVQDYLGQFRPHTAPKPTPHHETILRWVERQASERGLTLQVEPIPLPKLFVSEEESETGRQVVEAAREELEGACEAVAVMFAKSTTENRNPPVETLLSVVKKLKQKGVQVILDPFDARADGYETLSDECYVPHENDLGGGGVRSLFGVVRHAEAVISVDTYGLWMSYAIRMFNAGQDLHQPKIIGVFGSSNPRAVAPCDDWVLGKAPCGGPCGVHGYFSPKDLSCDLPGQSYFTALRDRGFRFATPDGRQEGDEKKEACVFGSHDPQSCCRRNECILALEAQDIVGKTLGALGLA